ncbi:MAG: hypothetical protein RL692_366 [Planctomycetota bacterium]
MNLIGVNTSQSLSGWISPLLQAHQIPHWFSKRDPPDSNWIAQRLGSHNARAARVKQVHGSRCVDAATCDGDPLQLADAIITNDPLIVPIISTADCCPVLVVCLKSKSCAAIHAGWRGIALNIVGESLRALVERFGADPKHMIASIGPCASVERYEVGEDVMDAFTQQGLSEALRSSPSAHKAFANCSDAVRILLERSGMKRDLIESNPPCTIGDATFASHRREPENKVRMLSGVAIPR